MKEARGISPRNKRIVEDYYARTQSGPGCTRTCTKNGTNDFANFTRSLRHACACVRVATCLYGRPCAGVRSYCSGRNGRVTLASPPRVCARARAYTRTFRARAHPLRGVCTAVDSLGPEDISQRGRRRSRSNPEGCSFSQPSGSLSSLRPPSVLRPPRFVPVGVEGESFSFAPPSQGTTLQLE
jgi:hypothetical protein